MDENELIENLGTIAHSGSKNFIKSISESSQKETNLIGQFGVGFYSAFMVSDDVEVKTKSWKENSTTLSWLSDGKTGYEISEINTENRGTSITISLREEHEEFSKNDRVKEVLESYSSFVPFPIMLNGERVNNIEALWMKSKSDISEEDYTAFYKFAAKAFDEPRYRLHFNADAPLMINSLVFVPKENPKNSVLVRSILELPSTVIRFLSMDSLKDYCPIGSGFSRVSSTVRICLLIFLEKRCRIVLSSVN